jgi:hypothetical protein
MDPPKQGYTKGVQPDKLSGSLEPNVYRSLRQNGGRRSAVMCSSSSRRLVAEEDIPIAEGSRLCKLQLQFLFDAVEHRPPLAQNSAM